MDVSNKIKRQMIAPVVREKYSHSIGFSQRQSMDKIHKPQLALLDVANEAFIIQDKRNTIMYWSKGAEKMYGFRKKEAEGQLASELLHTVFPQKLEKIQKEVLKKGSWKGELQHTTKTGSLLMIESSWVLYKDDKQVYFLEVNEDVTDKQRNEEEMALKASIIENSDDAIMAITPNGAIQSWNQGAANLYGYTSAEIIGQTTVKLMPSNKKDEFPKFMDQLQRGIRIKHYETKRLTKEGREIDVSISISPIKNNQGKIIGAAKIVRDITELKRNERNLTILSEVSKVISSSLDYEKTLPQAAKIIVPFFADWCAIDVIDESGELKTLALTHKDPSKVVWANTLRKKYPINLDDPVGVGKVIQSGKSEFYPLISDELLEKSIADKQQLDLSRKIGFSSAIIVPLWVNHETIGAMEFVATESKLHFSPSDLTLAEEIGRRVGLAIENSRLYEDAKKEISERKRLERQKDDFISIASHELKTPVTSIKAYEQVLQHYFKNKGEGYAVEQLQKMDGQIDKLTSLITDLLDVTKIDSNRMSFHFEKYDFDELVKEIHDELQRTTNKHSMIIEGASGKKLIGDKDRTGQVLTNLITNAIKYSPHGDKIIISLFSDTSGVKVCVQDFGIGIPKSKQERIFERFFRVSGPKENTFPGMGLGLYISSEIVKRQGGRIWVESAVGKGSSFCFYLPLKSKAKEV